MVRADRGREGWGMATIRYIVDDVDAAVAFYEGILGFELRERMGVPFAVLTDGDLTLWIAGPGTSARKPMPDGRVPVPGGWNRLVIEVWDLEAVVSKLLKAGATFRNEIIGGPGGNQVLVEDPSGNPVELFEAR
jgi:catechol 2,3-dioxygenase-like lactoylglutathione lyase family enzyme